jgi:hypothetical protein
MEHSSNCLRIPLNLKYLTTIFVHLAFTREKRIPYFLNRLLILGKIVNSVASASPLLQHLVRMNALGPYRCHLPMSLSQFRLSLLSKRPQWQYRRFCQSPLVGGSIRPEQLLQKIEFAAYSPRKTKDKESILRSTNNASNCYRLDPVKEMHHQRSQTCLQHRKSSSHSNPSCHRNNHHHNYSH